MKQIVVPQLGESVTEATVSKWLKKEGESVKADEPIVELETDKVTLEVNAPSDGVIARITAGEGQTVEVGATLGELDSAAAANDVKRPAEAAAPAAPPPVAAAPASAPADDSRLSPSVRKMLGDNNVDAAQISPSGTGGRITKEDVARHMASGAAPAPVVQAAPPPPPPPPPPPAAPVQKASPPPPVATAAPPTPAPAPKQPAAPRATGAREERVKMTRLRQVIAKRLKEAQNTAAILTTYNEADMGAVMELRNQYKDVFEKKHGVKLGFMSFFVKAALQALKEFPAVNAEIDGDDIIYKNYYDIGCAVSTPQGLVVPVIREADTLSMAAIEKSIMDMGARAREGKLKLEEMQGGTFTITNGGVFGSLMSMPILNSPQSGILGMHKIMQRPMVMSDGKIEARPMMYLAFSYDHRMIDGREAVGFLVRIKEAIENPQRLLLDV